MNVSIRTVHRIHGAALDNFTIPDEKILPP